MTTFSKFLQHNEPQLEQYHAHWTI